MLIKSNALQRTNKENLSIDERNKQRRNQKRTVNRDTLTKNIKRVTGWINQWTNQLSQKPTNYGWISQRKKKEISLAINSDKKKNYLKPHKRFELSSPGLRDQGPVVRKSVKVNPGLNATTAQNWRANNINITPREKVPKLKSELSLTLS